MCGITGYVGVKNATPVLINALKKLEYRGYDSAGIAVYDGQELLVRKSKGALKFLESKIAKETIQGSIGIGHTRWATHGKPSDINSHPHTDSSNTIAVVHNGIIENYAALKANLENKGYVFKSQTDTEVIAQLIHFYYKNDILEAVAKTLKDISGTYALAVICKKQPDRIIVARKDSPLVIGTTENEQFIASDVTAFLNFTRSVYYLNDGEIAEIKKDSINFFNHELILVTKQPVQLDLNVDSAEKCGFNHFMLKEIHEQPQVLNDAMISHLTKDKKINLPEIDFENELKNISRIVITACGTAYHAGLVGKYVIEHFARIPVDIDIASEYRYRDPIFSPNTLFVVISQSGETADTLAAMRTIKQNGAHVIGITNVASSTLAREADSFLCTNAGPEIAVASTKAFTAQLISIYLIALKLAEQRNTISKETLQEIISELKSISGKAELILKNKNIIEHFAAKTFDRKKHFFIGRQTDYAISLESALKLKEICYTHTEAFAAGELKHGAIALIDDDAFVIAICTQRNLFAKMDSAIKEVKARNAHVLCITFEGEHFFDNAADEVLFIPETKDELAPLLSIIPCQLYAYYCAVQLSLDPDKPRNLAKSVTVE